ncbi:hypothetical protein D3C75_1064380 [compost metagenome]
MIERPRLDCVVEVFAVEIFKIYPTLLKVLLVIIDRKFGCPLVVVLLLDALECVTVILENVFNLLPDVSISGVVPVIYDKLTV